MVHLGAQKAYIVKEDNDSSTDLQGPIAADCK